LRRQSRRSNVAVTPIARSKPALEARLKSPAAKPPLERGRQTDCAAKLELERGRRTDCGGKAGARMRLEFPQVAKLASNV
jgi:hypothetical protein